MVEELTALKTWRLFDINFFFKFTIEECTFDIHLINYEVHTSRTLKVSTAQSKVTTVSIKISTAGTYYCLCSVSAAGYKDTTVADLQLLEDLLLSRG
ncbi:hypothetical protein Tco_0692931 [Tanacetum coccineum]